MLSSLSVPSLVSGESQDVCQPYYSIDLYGSSRQITTAAEMAGPKGSCFRCRNSAVQSPMAQAARMHSSDRSNPRYRAASANSLMSPPPKPLPPQIRLPAMEIKIIKVTTAAALDMLLKSAPVSAQRHRTSIRQKAGNRTRKFGITYVSRSETDRNNRQSSRTPALRISGREFIRSAVIAAANSNRNTCGRVRKQARL